MSGRGPTRSERVYKALLAVYPRAFREAYGAQMAQVFGDLCRERRERAGLVGLVALWVRTVPDLLRTALSERTRTASGATFVLPVAGSPRMVRWGGLAAICGAVCSLTAMILNDLSMAYTREPILNALAAYGEGVSSHSPFIVLLHPTLQALLDTMAGIFFVTAFVGLYALVCRRAGGVALFAGVLMCASLPLLAVFAGSSAYRALQAFADGIGEVWSSPFLILMEIVTPFYLLGALLLGAAVFKAGVLGRWSFLPLVLLVLPLLLEFVLIDLAFPVQYGPQAVREGWTTLAIVRSPQLLTCVLWFVIGCLMWRSPPAVADRDAATVEPRGRAAPN